MPPFFASWTATKQLPTGVSMPTPLVILVIAPVIVGLAVTAALKWDDIVILLKGKRIAILGARGVGKSHMWRFLQTESIPERYDQTVLGTKIESRRFQLRDLSLSLKAGSDFGGEKADYAAWYEACENADFVFYLFFADRLLARDSVVESRVRDDAQHICQWFQEQEEKQKKAPRLFFVGTFCDRDPAFASSQLGDYLDRLRKLPVVDEIVKRAGGFRKVTILLGSMRTRDDTEKLVYSLLQNIAEK